MTPDAPGGALVERACAKVNLSLVVLGRRADGLHDLDGMVAFADLGDTLSVEPDAPLGLDATGGGDGLGPAEDNLVLKAARAFRARWPGSRAGRFALEKRLPVAAGLGGGSADAAAALRLLARLNGVAVGDPALIAVAARVGADVPVCVEGLARRMAGTGDRLGAPVDGLALPAVLVNPLRPCSTGLVFAALGLAAGEAGPSGDSARAAALDLARARGENDALAILKDARNDLEAPALRVEPEIGAVLDALRRDPATRVARMSGSGATCFALCSAAADASALAGRIASDRPSWWVRAVTLGHAPPSDAPPSDAPPSDAPPSDAPR